MVIYDWPNMDLLGVMQQVFRFVLRPVREVFPGLQNWYTRLVSTMTCKNNKAFINSHDVSLNMVNIHMARSHHYRAVEGMLHSEHDAAARLEVLSDILHACPSREMPFAEMWMCECMHQLTLCMGDDTERLRFVREFQKRYVHLCFDVLILSTCTVWDSTAPT